MIFIRQMYCIRNNNSRKLETLTLRTIPSCKNESCCTPCHWVLHRLHNMCMYRRSFSLHNIPQFIDRNDWYMVTSPKSIDQMLSAAESCRECADQNSSQSFFALRKIQTIQATCSHASSRYHIALCRALLKGADISLNTTDMQQPLCKVASLWEDVTANCIHWHALPTHQVMGQYKDITPSNMLAKHGCRQTRIMTIMVPHWSTSVPDVESREAEVMVEELSVLLEKFHKPVSKLYQNQNVLYWFWCIFYWF